MDDAIDKMRDSDALYYLTNLNRNPSGKVKTFKIVYFVNN